MNWLRFIFIVALLVLFVTTAITAIFGSGKMLTAIFRAYVFKVEICEFAPYFGRPFYEEGLEKEKTFPAQQQQEQQQQETERVCKVDYNRAKEDIANGLAMLIIAAPLSMIFFLKTKKHLFEK